MSVFGRSRREVSRVESTRCRGVSGGIAGTLATRAKWQVDSGSSTSRHMLDAEMVGEGVIGNTGDEGTRTGKVVIELVLESAMEVVVEVGVVTDEDDDGDDDEEEVWDTGGNDNP